MLNRVGWVTSLCALGLLLAACGEAGSAGGDAAPADGTAEFKAAADALAARLAGNGPVPAASDPVVQAFETQTARALDTLGTPALPLRGFQSYDDLCAKTATVVGAYVNAGTAQAPAEGQLEIQNRNAELYIDQLFTPLLFSAHCSAAHLPFLESTLSPSELQEKAAAVQQVRSGALGQFAGLLQMAGADDLDAARRARIVRLLAADAAEFAIIFTPQQRQELGQMAERVRAAVPEGSREEAARIGPALNQAACGRLCSH